MLRMYDCSHCTFVLRFMDRTILRGKSECYECMTVVTVTLDCVLWIEQYCEENLNATNV